MLCVYAVYAHMHVSSVLEFVCVRVCGGEILFLTMHYGEAMNYYAHLLLQYIKCMECHCPHIPTTLHCPWNDGAYIICSHGHLPL